MYIFLIVVHVIAAILLVAVVLVQRGRGGGLVESFSGVESMFGTKTSLFLTRTTAALATLFLFTSISLALLAARQTRSLIDEEVILPVQEQTTEDRLPAEESGVSIVGEEEVIQEEVVQQEDIAE